MEKEVMTMDHGCGFIGDVELTPFQASQVLGVSRSTLKRMEQDGVLTGYETPGGHTRYLASEVEAVAQGMFCGPDEDEDDEDEEGDDD